MDNLHKIDASKIHYEVRSVIIKDINDKPDDILLLKKIYSTLSNCSKWSLFACHDLGNAKSIQIGSNYRDLPESVSDEHLAMLSDILNGVI